MTKVTQTAPATVVTMTGVLKFWNEAKGFGFVATPHGDVFVHVTVVKDKKAAFLTDGANITLFVMTEQKGERVQRTATRVVDIVLPAVPEERTVWAVVKTFNPDLGSATVFLGEIDLLDQTAFIPRSVMQQSSAFPGVGMPLRAVVKHTPQGWDVLSYESGDEVSSQCYAYMAEQLKRVEQLRVEELAAAAKVATRKPKPKRQPQSNSSAEELRVMFAAAAARNAGSAFAAALEKGNYIH